MKPVYQAANEEAALEALGAFEASELGQRYPAAVKTFTDAWEQFTPFLSFPPMLRKVIKNRGHFPNDAAAVKLLWLAICNIEDKRACQRRKEKGLPAGKRRAPGRLVEGAATTNWKQALQQLALAYPDRINPHL